ncbi:MAG: TIGR04283 family arsenosugar biosynthesis glycosyltransferase [Bacteroidota bacterium]
MRLSIIIPTLNEADQLPQLLDALISHTYTYDEIIVVDAQSTDKTQRVAKNYPIKLIVSEKACRARQMNLGAQHAVGDLFYFVHADVRPPATFRQDIEESLARGSDAGCYRFEFDLEAPMLKFNAWWTRFNFMFCRGGDQTLFVQRTVFEAMKGFDEEYIIMEDFDFIRRLRKKYRFRIMPKSVLVSARKYAKNSYLKVNLVNLWSYWTFMLGRDPQKIRAFYKRHLRF